MHGGGGGGGGHNDCWGPMHFVFNFQEDFLSSRLIVERWRAEHQQQFSRLLAPSVAHLHMYRYGSELGGYGSGTRRAIAGHERLLLAKWHPNAEKNCEIDSFSTLLTDMKSCTVDRDCMSAPKDDTKLAVLFRFLGVFPLTFQWKTACRGDLQTFKACFVWKSGKKALGSNGLSTLHLMPKTPGKVEKEIVCEVVRVDKHNLRKSANHKVQISFIHSTHWVDLCFAICRVYQVVFVTWNDFTQNLLFYFQ